jgi:heme/copper-type cytochrome/quinol oxidase subunit 4
VRLLGFLLSLLFATIIAMVLVSTFGGSDELITMVMRLGYAVISMIVVLVVIVFIQQRKNRRR